MEETATSSHIGEWYAECQESSLMLPSFWPARCNRLDVRKVEQAPCGVKHVMCQRALSTKLSAKWQSSWGQQRLALH